VKFAYIPSSICLEDEIRFGMDNFDFLEITLTENTEKYYRPGDRNIGHLYWENTLDDIEIVKKYKRFGCKWITIHPVYTISYEENVKRIKNLAESASKFGIDLYIENLSRSPYNTFEVLNELFDECGAQGITMDTGHLKLNINEIEKFLKSGKVRHVHFHKYKDGIDHLAFGFDEAIALYDIIRKRYDGTICFEMFYLQGDNTRKEWAVKNRQEYMLKLKKLLSRRGED